ncbi:MAG: hypothetical protein KUL82_12295 [Bdellovibrio sp.]|uniref:hypothetical protein n=1 Tax=Bdellovibrio sp. TaxID=28201 RepID=UPI0039E350AC|nr:hypothetical protein [Bdellovibrio sp.]
MRKLMPVLLLVCLATLGGCSQEEGNVEVVVSSSAFPLIPATAASCLADKNAGADTPTADISPDYFRIPTITFNRKDTSKTLVIAFIRISIQIPGSSQAVSCEVGGDGLAALRDSWFSGTTKEALVPAGTASFSTDCALYCGGVKAPSGMTASGSLEVFGLERATNGDETPVKASTVVTIQSF